MPLPIDPLDAELRRKTCGGRAGFGWRKWFGVIPRASRDARKQKMVRWSGQAHGARGARNASISRR